MPPVTSAETSSEKAPTRNPYEAPNSYPAQMTRKKIGLKPPTPLTSARRRAASIAARAARSASRPESRRRAPASISPSTATAPRVTASVGTSGGSPKPRNGQMNRTIPAIDTAAMLIGNRLRKALRRRRQQAPFGAGGPFRRRGRHATRSFYRRVRPQAPCRGWPGPPQSRRR